MEQQINIGVIGCGYWGPNLIRNFVEISASNVLAIADCKTERLNYIHRCYPQIELTTNYKDLFDMPLDAVVVATPPATHFQIAQDCLKHNLHVFVEKPLTLSSEDAEKLIDLAEQRDLTLMVGHTFEYNPAVRALKEIISRGELGQIYYVDAVRVNLGLFNPTLNVLWDLAPHDLSILRYILDRDPIKVSAQGGSCIFKDTHDIAYLHLVFPDNVLAHIHISWLDPCKVRRITVVGSRKMAVYDDVDTLEKIKIYDKGVDPPPYTNTYGDFQCSYRYGDVLVPNIHFVEPLRLECQHFLDCIIKHAEPQSSGRVGLKVVQILETAQRSLQNGGTQEIIKANQGQRSRHVNPQL